MCRHRDLVGSCSYWNQVCIVIVIHYDSHSSKFPNIVYFFVVSFPELDGCKICIVSIVIVTVSFGNKTVNDQNIFYSSKCGLIPCRSSSPLIVSNSISRKTRKLCDKCILLLCF